MWPFPHKGFSLMIIYGIQAIAKSHPLYPHADDYSLAFISVYRAIGAPLLMLAGLWEVRSGFPCSLLDVFNKNGTFCWNAIILSCSCLHIGYGLVVPGFFKTLRRLG